MTAKRFTLNVDGETINDGDNRYCGEDVVELLNELNDENEQLKQEIENGIESFKRIQRCHTLTLVEENEQLKQRNDRQAKQLDRLYRLIEEKEWRTLTDILDDFKRCEEQLQRESGTYGGLE